jgi:hypothetical protein
MVHPILQFHERRRVVASWGTIIGHSISDHEEKTRRMPYQVCFSLLNATTAALKESQTDNSRDIIQDNCDVLWQTTSSCSFLKLKLEAGHVLSTLVGAITKTNKHLLSRPRSRRVMSWLMYCRGCLPDAKRGLESLFVFVVSTSGCESGGTRVQHLADIDLRSSCGTVSQGLSY